MTVVADSGPFIHLALINQFHLLKPFLEFDFLDIQEPLIDELKKLSKASFDINDMMTVASELKYTREI